MNTTWSENHRTPKFQADAALISIIIIHQDVRRSHVCTSDSADLIRTASGNVAEQSRWMQW